MLISQAVRDARKRALRHGDLVEVSSRRGAVRVRAIVSRQVRPGCIWMPLHVAEARANLLTNGGGDPITGTAEYKVCAAEVVKVESAPEGVELFPGSYYHEHGPGPGEAREPLEPVAEPELAGSRR